MKLSNAKTESTPNYRLMLLTCALVVVATAGAACTDKLAQKAEINKPSQATVKTAALQTSNAPMKSAELKPVDKTVLKQANAPLKFRSRDYAVSFEYPWQYSFAGAKTISENESLQPKNDGTDGQITLARIDLPKGFYPDSDFESGYFTLSLNPDVEEQDCKLNGDAQSAKINGIDFLWIEQEQIGKGGSSKIRSYTAYANEVCYQFELGVKTKNENGLAREVNADQVMRRLEGMLKTVKFDGIKSKAPEVQSSIEQPKDDGSK
jgi:hypothetical protein